jgi:4-amino-4-deoxy-L-arabinose transferase-like glycosyltransferase
MIAYAASAIPNPVNDLQGVFDMMCLFAAYFIWTVIIVCVIMVVVAAFYYVTSAGEAEKLTKARQLLTYSAVGVVVVLCAVMFPVIVGTAVGYQSAQGGGLTPMCALLGGTGGSGSATAN